MLLELRVENLLLIERAELRLGRRFNVLTGETGAGKTVLARALDLLLGGKPRPGIVRPGAAEAYVEGVFKVSPGILEDPALADLRERLPAGEEEVVLARRVGAEGRTRAFVGGRAATAADLRALGGRLVSFYGQHEHRKLTVATAQLELLDRFCGPEHLAARRAFGESHARVLASGRELDDLKLRVGARDRDLDLLAFEIAEIEELSPTPGEEGDLLAERERLRSLDALRAAAGAGAEALSPEGPDGVGVSAMLAEAERHGAAAAGADPALDALAERLRTLAIEAAELATELRRYRSGLEAEPGRLEQVEERLELYDRLKRKHGGSVDAVLAHAERCRGERDRLERADADVRAVEEALAEARADAERRAAALTTAREQAAPRLAERVRDELSALAMPGASFEAVVDRREAPGPAGNDRVEFLIAPNPGVAATPLRDTASGGELSRIMLALMTVASAGAGETIVFDEVDAGLGGRTARAVGERLRGLAASTQIVCITHLPQVAALADEHLRIEKRAGEDVTAAVVERLDEPRVLDELCRMLGSDTSDAGARQHAEELLAAA